jgi:TP901 family phage tail tape measure protein
MSRTENRRVNVYINQEEAVKQMDKLRAASTEVKQEIEALTPGTERFVERAKKLEDAQNKLNGLTESAKKFQRELSTMDKSTKEYATTSNQFNRVQREVDKAAKSVDALSFSQEKLTNKQAELATLNTRYAQLSAQLSGKLGPSMRDLEIRASKLRNELRLLPEGTADFVRKSGELRVVEQRLQQIKQEAKATRDAFTQVSTTMKGWVGVAVGSLAAQTIQGMLIGVVGKIQNTIDANAKLSDSFADVRKTTGLTVIEMELLNKKLGEIDTRTSRMDLLGIAAIGGQLGLEKSEILSFTETMDRLSVALRQDFGGDAALVADRVGRLRNTFTDIKTAKVDEDLLNIGNALNTLAAEGQATAPVITDFAGRIGGVGITMGLTSGQVLGLSATLQELNVKAERGGTAVTRILQSMTTNTKAFAQVAGMDLTTFTNRVNNDLMAALVAVAEGTAKGGQQATAMGEILKDLGLQGSGVSEVMAKLGSNTDLLRLKMDRATESLKATDSIMDEFNLKNTNMAANLEKIQKRLAGLFTSGFLKNMLEGVVEFMEQVTRATETNADRLNKTKESVKNLESSLIPLVKRYEVLADAQDKSADQAELKGIVEAIGAILPQAVTEFDKYGKAIDISTEKLRQHIDLKKGILPQQTERAIEEEVKKVEMLTASHDRLLRMLNERRKQVTENRGPMMPGQTKVVAMETEEIKKLMEEVAALQAQIDASEERLAELRGEMKDVVTNATKEVVIEDDATIESNYQALLQKFIALHEQMDKVRTEADLKGLSEQEEQFKRLLLRYEQYRADVLKKLEEVNADATLKDAERADLRKKYQEELLAIDETYLIEQGRLEEKYMNEFLQKQAQYTDKRNELTYKILFEQADGREKEQMQLMQHYDKLIAQAQEYGIDSYALEVMRINAMQLLKDKWYQQDQEAEQRHNMALLRGKVKLAQSVGDLTAGMQTFIASVGAESSDFGKVLALFNIATQTGIAIANAIAGATAAAAATGPAAPFVLPIKIASMTGAVLTGMGKAISVMGKTAPAPPIFSYSGVGVSNSQGNAPRPPGFFFGGPTGNKAIGRDQFGGIAGVVHTNEYVVSSSMMADQRRFPLELLPDAPRMADFVNIAEAMRRNTVGNVSASRNMANKQADAGQMHDELRALNQRIDRLIEEQAINRAAFKEMDIAAIITWKDTDTINLLKKIDLQNKRDNITNL